MDKKGTQQLFHSTYRPEHESSTDKKCLYEDEHYHIQTSKGKIMKPCMSMSCPKHRTRALQQWATRIERELSRDEYAEWFTLPIGEFLERKHMSMLWQKFSRSMRYNYPRARYCFRMELQNGNLHLHGVIINECHIDGRLIRKQWHKFLKKLDVNQHRRPTTHSEVVHDAIGIAEYITSTGKYAGKDEIIPRNLYHRQIFASSGWGYESEEKMYEMSA